MPVSVRARISGCLAGGDDLALIDCDDVLEAFGLLHVGGRHQKRHIGPFGANSCDELPELPPRQRIDAGRRLVEDQKIGIVDECAAEAEFLLHSAGQFAGWPVREGIESRSLEQARDARAAFAFRLSIQPAKEIDVFDDGERRVKVAAKALAACRRCAVQPCLDGLGMPCRRRRPSRSRIECV